MSAVPQPAAPGLDAAPPSRPDDPSAPIAREGWPFVFGAFLLTVAAAAGGWAWLGPAGLALAVPPLLVALFCLWFFRDPQRPIPDAPGLVVSPADGVILSVEPGAPPEELGLKGGEWTKIVIFLNVFDVHVNRSPVAGRVIAAARKAGKFAHAGRPEAQHNQRASLAIERASGAIVVVVQVTGLIARRIVCRAAQGQSLRAGERFGLIRFGSRTDVFLPAGSRVLVAKGQRVAGGSSIIAHLPAGA
ncbi:MAG TPA: phosphatidylserine decarboxylase [Phycisphaerales bacterium]|nr:phosphatidylserine decarboxylase [Phycisphaerales bacterium]